jgi:hypothetical protein
MKHKIVGKVADLKLNNEGNFADVIVKRINENDSPLVMGQFILLTTKDDSKVYVGKVESEIPYVDAGLNYRGALIDSINTDVEIDALYKEANGLFLSYKLRMLGICYDNDKDVKYYSNIRTFPAQTSLFVAVPTKDFMNQLLLRYL